MAEYEYTIIMRNLTPGKALPQVGDEEFADQLAQTLHKTLQDCLRINEQMQGGGWEVLSHSMTSIDRHIPVTFLLRRPK